MGRLDDSALAARFEKSCRLDSQTQQTSCAGYEGVLQALRELVIWPSQYSSEAQALGLRWAKGCLLHGPPGVGKSTLVRVRPHHRLIVC